MVNPEGGFEIRDEAAELQMPHGEPGAESTTELLIPLVAYKDASKEDDGSVETPGNEKSTVKKPRVEFQGLTKEQLDEFANNPFWKRMRLIFFILFWVVWVSMLAAVIIIIVVSPKCPPRPPRQFWQKPFYRLQVKSFASAKDADPTAAGSIDGLVLKMDYLRQTLGINNFIIDSLVSTSTPTGCTADFKSHNASLVNIETLKSLTKQGRKKGFNILMEFDASQADIDWWNPADGSDGFHEVFNATDGELPKLASRNGGKAWRSRRLHLPQRDCPSLNVTSPRVLAKLEEAFAYWLDAGLSGFVLTNVAFMSPTPGVFPAGLTAANWFDADPTPLLFSNASVDFVRSVRRFITSQAEKRGRELALLVDPGNTGFPQPEARLAAYLDPTGGAHAVVSTSLGAPLSPLASREHRAPRQLIEDTMKAVGEKGSVAFATAWPSLRRPGESFWTALSLILPGVPCLYYGQELGMGHVAGVRLQGKGLTSYLTGEDSTDVSETPMQWSESPSNAGWLTNSTTPLTWVDLSPRADDIEMHNLRRMSSSGYPASELQLVQRLVQLIGSTESLQWGVLTFLPSFAGSAAASPSDLIVFKRQAERFQPVVVVVNAAVKPTTLDLSGTGSTKGTLKVMHSSTASSASSYQLDHDYPLDRVFAPAKSILVFLGKEAE